MRGIIRNIAIAATAAALLSGCGGDDAPIEPISNASTSTTGGTLSQADFITSADARCGEANAALANLSTDTGAATTTVSQEQSITAGLLSGLQGIGDAEDPDGSLADFYSALSDEVSILKDQEQAIASGDTAGADALDADLDSAKAAATAAAEQYGFEECGQEGTALPATGTSTTVSPTTAATTTTTPVAPTPTPTPVDPAPVEPTTPPPATGGTGTGGGTTAPPPSSGGSSGGISAG